METLKSCSLVFVDGDWIESKDQSDNGIRLVQTGNVGNGEYLDKSDRAKFISEDTFLELKCTEIFEGDILISRLPDPVGRSCLLPNIGKAITAVDCSILRVDTKKCIPEFLVYYTQTEIYKSKISQFLAGTTRTRISRKNLENIEINLPDLNEQKKIVDILSKVDKLISYNNNCLIKLEDLVKSRFIELFGEPLTNSKGWKTECLFSIAPTKQIPFELSDKVWLLNLDAVESNTGTVLFKNIVSDNEVNASTVMFSTDNVLYSKLRPYLNKVVLPDDKGVATSELLPLYPDKAKLNRVYLCYWLRSDAFVKHISEKVAGAKMPRVSMDYFRSIDIELPPIDLQNQFAEFVEQTDKLKFEIKEALEKLETLKKSLMQEYFG